MFAQMMAHLPLSTFRRCMAALRGDYKVQDFSCLDQFLAMAFAQPTARESLRAIEGNLRAQSGRLYHMGFRCQTISRNTLANANATRPWQIYADFAQHLITLARPLYAKDPLHIDLDATVYAFDATTAIKGSESLTHLEDKDSDPLPGRQGLRPHARCTYGVAVMPHHGQRRVVRTTLRTSAGRSTPFGTVSRVFSPA